MNKQIPMLRLNYPLPYMIDSKYRLIPSRLRG